MAYTYLIGWSSLKKYYYGLRYKKGCKPEDLFTTYFTSSVMVKNYYNKYGTPDIIQIRKIFEDGNKAIAWETKVLKRMKVKYREDFLNLNDNMPKTYVERRLKRDQIEILRKINTGKIVSEETRQKLSKANKGRKHTNETRIKMSKSKTGVKHSPEHIEARTAPRRGVPARPEREAKRRASRTYYSGELSESYGTRRTDEEKMITKLHRLVQSLVKNPNFQLKEYHLNLLNYAKQINFDVYGLAGTKTTRKLLNSFYT